MAEAIQAIALDPMLANTQGTAAVAPVDPQNTTPFQVMLDAAVNGLQEVSATEDKTKAYIAQYAKGNVSIEEVMMEVSKMTMVTQLATTVLNHAVTTFKEIQQMPV
jgi:flagellar hook-basal body complex protein FliE